MGLKAVASNVGPEQADPSSSFAARSAESKSPKPEGFGVTLERLAELRQLNLKRKAQSDRVYQVILWTLIVPFMLWLVYEQLRTARSLGTAILALFSPMIPLLVTGELVRYVIDRLPFFRPDPRPAAFDAAVARWEEQERRIEEEKQRRAEKFWTSLSGWDFEREVAALLGRLGHKVRKVGGAGDEGIDLWRDDTPVQCKQHQKALGPRVVRELVGACRSAGASSGILITTRGVSDAAQDYASRNGIEVWDVQTLVRLARQAAGG